MHSLHPEHKTRARAELAIPRASVYLSHASVWRGLNCAEHAQGRQTLILVGNTTWCTLLAGEDAGRTHNSSADDAS
eukprot:gene15506-biopygen12732